jgi:ryanodine receptor 2
VPPVTPYAPEPVAASVPLPAPLAGVTERLAERIHDAWAARRLEEGWTRGPRRDDARKTHPGLVPYDELPESEKEYDRQTARAAILTLLALGYRVVPPGGTDAAGATEAEGATDGS